MKEALQGIFEKAEELRQNPHIVFSLMEFYFLMNISSSIVFSKPIYKFFIDDFQLKFEFIYFVFFTLFFMLFFILWFVSTMARVFLKRRLFSVAYWLENLFYKSEKTQLQYPLSDLKDFSRKTNNYVLYDIVCKQEKKEANLTKQLDSNFLLGFTFFVNIFWEHKLNIESIFSEVLFFKECNAVCYYSFLILSVVIGLIIVFRWLHSFLSYSEYRSGYITCSEYDEVAQTQLKEGHPFTENPKNV